MTERNSEEDAVHPVYDWQSPLSVKELEDVADREAARLLCDSMALAADNSARNYKITWQNTIISRIDDGLGWAKKSVSRPSVEALINELSSVQTRRRGDVVRKFAEKHGMRRCRLANAYQALVQPQPSAREAKGLMMGMEVVSSAHAEHVLAIAAEVCSELSTCGGGCSYELGEIADFDPDAEHLFDGLANNCPEFGSFRDGRTDDVKTSLRLWLRKKLVASAQLNKKFLTEKHQRTLDAMLKIL